MIDYKHPAASSYYRHHERLVTLQELEAHIMADIRFENLALAEAVRCLEKQEVKDEDYKRDQDRITILFLLTRIYRNNLDLCVKRLIYGKMEEGCDKNCDMCIGKIAKDFATNELTY